MKPEQFIREFGVEKAREVVEGSPNYNYQRIYFAFTNGTKVDVNDLKRLVESLERINKCGGLYGFKTYCNGDYSEEDSQAIRDYKSIYGGGDE
ncbi:hypothetical protein ACG59Z_01095 [Acinetobacter sp. ABJ_C1_1]|uniref:hypothetical protein n=1 Tax=Acinetobacter sp. ABJ_C1_1 TaxID=3378321 RepID=UPI0037DC76AF